jgi:hypothetical protein
MPFVLAAANDCSPPKATKSSLVLSAHSCLSIDLYDAAVQKPKADLQSGMADFSVSTAAMRTFEAFALER